MNKASNRFPRREFLKLGTYAGVWALANPGRPVGCAPAFINPVGYAAISWPQEQFDHALETMSALGFTGVQCLGWVRDEYETRVEILRDRLASLRLKPVALSCGRVELDPEGPRSYADLIRGYASFFSRLGGQYLQVTDGGRPDVQYPPETIRRLGASMNELGRIVADHGLTMGYHPHVDQIGETREGMARILDATDERYVKLIADVGHMTLGGSDPAEIVRTYGSRLIFLHFKDVRKDAFEQARQSSEPVRARQYVFCEIGEGVVDFAAVLGAMRSVQFAGWIIVELDGNEPVPGGPDASARSNWEALGKLRR